MRCTLSLCRIVALPGWGTHAQPGEGAFASMSEFSLLIADGKSPFKLLRQRLSAARTWRALGGITGDGVAAEGTFPLVDYSAVGWPAPDGPGVWNGLAVALGRLNEQYAYDRSGELRLTTAGV